MTTVSNTHFLHIQILEAIPQRLRHRSKVSLMCILESQFAFDVLHPFPPDVQSPSATFHVAACTQLFSNEGRLDSDGWEGMLLRIKYRLGL